ncbi:endonuclease-reverse transcriptase [Elysia marginata]|uniref:Endonuclease-reverse transcriptase n=1 Tax=Elysia marginata TaxID=1093978 RepID=A0AAV4G5Z3_9GAST|nr:endonuclease-reverse transcriptase [Elysia marginata]
MRENKIIFVAPAVFAGREQTKQYPGINTHKPGLGWLRHSPTLASLVERIPTARQSLKRAAYPSTVSTSTICVDDTVILAEPEEQLQAILDRIVDKCKEYGKEINAKKTKTIHIGRETKALKITVGNAVLEQVSKYPYHGHMITEDVATLKEVQIRIEKTRQKCWENKELLRGNIGLNTKKINLTSYVFSVFNYGCEAWTYAKTVQKKTPTFERWCYRTFLKVPWTEKKNNKEIIQMADVGGRLLQQLM